MTQPLEELQTATKTFDNNVKSLFTGGHFCWSGYSHSSATILRVLRELWHHSRIPTMEFLRVLCPVCYLYLNAFTRQISHFMFVCLCFWQVWFWGGDFVHLWDEPNRAWMSRKGLQVPKTWRSTAVIRCRRCQALHGLRRIGDFLPHSATRHLLGSSIQNKVRAIIFKSWPWMLCSSCGLFSGYTYTQSFPKL